MEDVNLQIEKITGQANDAACCGVFSSRVSFGDGTIGTLVSCILVKGAGSSDGAKQVKEIFDLANKKLEGAQSGSLDILKRAGEISKEYTSSKNLDASFSLILFYKSASYIFRSGSKVKVWVYLGAGAQELSFENGSGHLKEGQIILIATEKFLSSFDLSDTLKEEDVNLEEVVDGLATEISAKGDQSEIGAALVLVKEGADAKVAIEDTQDEEVEKVDEDTQLDTSHEIAAAEPAIIEASAVEQPDSESSFEHEANKSDLLFDTNESQKTEPKSRPKLGRLLPTIARAIGSEVSKLRRGDIRAIFRLKRNIVAGALVVLLVLALSAFFTLRGNADRQTQSEFNTYLSSASSKYEEGLALLGLNQEKARGILIEADSAVKGALEIEPKDEQALALESKISAKLKETENLASVNFSTVVEVDGQLVSLSKNGENLVGLTGGKVHLIDVASQSADEIDGQSGARSAFVYDSKAFIFDGKDVNRVDLATGASDKIIEGQQAQDINVFLGNVYLLGADQIFKYVPIENGYAQSVNYLNQKEQFSTNSRLVIDGSIWVSSGSEVFQYLRGDKQGFAISGLSTPVGNLGLIYTDSQVENIYVVDSQNSALLVINKDGVYTKAYQSAEFAGASGLVVDEDNGKFYVAVGSKVLEGEL